MKINALAVANYLVEIANSDSSPLKLLGLMKRVYIVHGFCLAIYGKSILDKRFDKVEAWKYGPVIPSVYHSFKHYKDTSITNLETVLELGANNEIRFETPTLNDVDIQSVCGMVMKRYANFSDSEIVALTHKEGTPWSICYIEGMNAPIPDQITELHYQKIVSKHKKKVINEES